MPDVWVIRSEYGKYTGQFVDGAYVAAGWLRENDLSGGKSKDELTEMYRLAHPGHSTQKAGANVGQLRLFLEMEVGDYVITPCSDSQWIYYGRMADVPYQYTPSDRDGCDFPHRRSVAWVRRRFNVSEFSEEFQRALKFTQKTAFRVKQNEEFIAKVTQRVEVTLKYSKGEIANRGKMIYDDKIKALVEPEENGKFIVIDIESGDYEVDRRMLVASRRLRERRPDSARYGGRVGYDAAYHIGGRQGSLQ